MLIVGNHYLFSENRRFNTFNLSLSSNGGKKRKMNLFCSETSGSQRIRYIGDYFSNYGCKIVDEFTDFLAYNWVSFDFGRAISFLPSYSFTLMRVYMNTGIK